MTGSAAPGDEIRILALGDSYTIGESVTAAERWPMQLAAMLREQGRAVAKPEIVAFTGWTTDELAAAIETEMPRGLFDIVSLLIGVNNQYRGRATGEYRGEFRSLLEQAIVFAGERPSRVIVISIPDWGVMPFAAGRDAAAIAGEIDAYNAVNRDEAGRAGAPYADITPISRRASGEPELVAGDGLHPSGAMYAEWARLILPMVCAAL
ncbi:MAG TPA: SGNH/GDSL hydrolase family protein [Gemmatimonadaceae bacterium]|nr:SGNH/GDSL hydrolase family protein [Gemmatimonadaceae bacterium]